MTVQVSKSALQRTLGSMFRDEAKEAATGGLVAPEKARGLLKDAVKALVKEDGKATVDEVVDYQMRRVMATIGEVNQPKGKRGARTISQHEVDQARDLDKKAGAKIFKAYEILSGKSAGGTGLTGAEAHAQLKTLLKDVSFEMYFGNEGGSNLTPLLFEGKKLGCRSREELFAAIGIESQDMKRDMPHFDPIGKKDDEGKTALDAFLEENSERPKARAAAEKIAELIRGLKDVHVVSLGADCDSRVYNPNSAIHKRFVGDPEDENGCLHPGWIIGRASDGALVGFQNLVVWT